MANASVIPAPHQTRRGSLFLLTGTVLAVLAIVATLMALRHLGKAEGPYLRALADSGVKSHPIPGQMHFSLVLTIVVSLLAAIATGALSVLIRRPIARFRVVLLAVTAVIYLA